MAIIAGDLQKRRGTSALWATLAQTLASVILEDSEFPTIAGESYVIALRIVNQSAGYQVSGRP